MFSALKLGIKGCQGLQRFVPHRFCSTKELPFHTGHFQSAHIQVDKLDVNDTSEFSSRLWTTINLLRKQLKTAVYLDIPMEYSHYIPVAG